ncbi:unnamed protein product [Caenorhabditis brenneri]
MGQLTSKVSSLFTSNNENRVLMLGLDGAGKTAILYKLKFGNTDNIIPTIGFNMEKITIDKTTISLWDIGGQKHLWKFYYPTTKVLIYVVDSSNEERLQDTREELFGLLEEPELAKCPLLVVANKQDLPNALSSEELTEKFHLESIRNRKWHICGTSAQTGDGLNDGLKWVKEHIK